MITIDQVRARVEAIRSLVLDDEAAHGAEDELHREVLAAIAQGAPDAKELAIEALRTRAIRFSRWSA